jgi:hypothetical protein
MCDRGLLLSTPGPTLYIHLQQALLLLRLARRHGVPTSSDARGQHVCWQLMRVLLLLLEVLLLLLLVVVLLAMPVVGVGWGRAGRRHPKHVALGHLQVVCQLVKVAVQHIIFQLLLLLLLKHCCLLLDEERRLLLQLLQQSHIQACLCAGGCCCGCHSCHS